MADPVWKPNRGRCPEEAKGKRVAVRLANGNECDPSPVTTTSPPGWAADDKGGCRWTITGHPYDIKEYRIL